MVCSTSGLILCYNTIDLLITNNKPIELRREAKKRDLLLSLSQPSFYIPFHLSTVFLVLSVVVLGYGWKRLDFDIAISSINSYMYNMLSVVISSRLSLGLRCLRVYSSPLFFDPVSLLMAYQQKTRFRFSCQD